MEGADVDALNCIAFSATDDSDKRVEKHGEENRVRKADPVGVP
jgi:hypothetical protein